MLMKCVSLSRIFIAVFQKINFCFIVVFFFISFLPLFSQTAVNDYFSTNIDKSVNINLLGNDSGCAAYNLSINIQPSHGTITPTGTEGIYIYTPNAGFSGRDSLEYSIACNYNTSSAWAYFTVAPFPDNIYETDCYTSPEATQWGIRNGNTSSNTAYICAQPFVGDIDNDGQNEVVSLAYASNFLLANSIIIYNQDLQEKITFSVPSMNTAGGFPMAIADVDRDGIAEIFIHCSDGYVRCYNYNGSNVTTKWVSNQSVIANRTASPIIADVNADGIPDILIINKIFNAQTGELEVTLPASVGEEFIYYGRGLISMPVFADMDNDGLLEVVGGKTVIKVNITNPHGTTGNNAFVWKTISGTNIGDGPTSVADIDLDGFLDAVVVRSGCMYVWKPYTGPNSSPSPLGSVSYYSTNGFCGSRALVADINNDGYPEIAWTYSHKIQACKYNPVVQSLQTIWTHSTTDVSGSTVMSVFDFNQDGSAEIVYRDETHLRILSGVTGQNISTIPCESATGIEYPVIVDLDRDGSADIIVSESYNYYSGSERGRIRSFISPAGIKWAPARYVWNQHAYNAVHVNNDLTVPQFQFNPAATFSNPDNPGIIRRPFNNFLQQGGMLNQYAEPFYPLTDVAVIADSIKINSCDSVRVKIFIKNLGGQMLRAPFKVTVYKDNYKGNIIRVNTISQPLAGYGSGYISLVFSHDELRDISPINYLVFSVNDDGTGIAENGGQQAECDTTNNILAVPLPSFLYSKHTYLEDLTCQDQPYTRNGFNIPASGTMNSGIRNFERTLASSEGCDSIIHLKLNIYPYYNKVVEIKSCHSYEWNGQTYYQSGNYVKHLTSSQGCDSVVNLRLTIYPKQNTQDTAEACSSYNWNGQTYTESGEHIQHFGSVHGCDSTVHLQLKIHHPVSKTITDTACSSYNWSGQAYTESGNYSQHFSTIYGCDSTVHLELTIHPDYNIETTVETCSSYNWNGRIYAESGRYTQSLTTVHGCDSIVHLNLTIRPVYNTDTTIGVCYYYDWNGLIYTESGNYVQNFRSIHDCDSVVHLKLNVYSSAYSEFTARACHSYKWNEKTYYVSGNYAQLFTSVHGCDSIVHLSLTIEQGKDTSIFINDTIYRGEIYTLHGFDIPRQTTEGSHTFQLFLKDRLGCDSIINLILQVNPSNVILDFPNAFMPDKAPNNYFSVARKYNVKNLKIQIYNRWGDQVYQSSDINFKWDGRDSKGSMVPAGAYIYTIEYHSETNPNIAKQKTGSINVIY